MNGRAYYNEIDPFAAQWLRNLVAAGHIAPGDVDERSIVDVKPDDVRGYTQCHFFAGIGGWSVALRLAGWHDDRPCWTGSCPCQPLSGAGQRKGHADKRHLWPAFFDLIAECRPSVCFGEQVASPLGREWLAGIRADLEDAGFACGAANLCAASVSSPQDRPRLYWVADANNTNEDGWSSGRQQPLYNEDDDHPQGMGSPEGEQWNGVRPERRGWRQFANAGEVASNFWKQFDVAECDDGWRRIEPGAQPLVNGVPGRLDKLRGFGNAIVAPLAAEFIRAYLEARGELGP